MASGILFLGVPHSGTPVAFLASLLSCTAYWRGSSSTLLELMSEGGHAIKALESDFFELYVHQYPRPYICDILEGRPERVGRLILGPVSLISYTMGLG